MRIPRREPEKARIEVIPMIDILLVLLIIFMISQPLSRMAMDIQVPPQERQQATSQVSTQIVLELTDDGGFAINSQPVPKDQLDALYASGRLRLPFEGVLLFGY